MEEKHKIQVSLKNLNIETARKVNSSLNNRINHLIDHILISLYNWRFRR